MVFRKQIPGGSTGTASEFGGDDINVYDKFLSGTDVTASITGPTNINTPVEWESGKLSIGNGTNANKISITSSAQSGNFNLNIPILGANTDILTTGTAAALATANTFTEVNTISKDDVTPLKLYRPINTANSLLGLAYYFKNSSNTQTLFSRVQAKLITNTAGAEVGSYEINLIKAGSVTKVFNIDSSGLITLGTLQNSVVPSVLLNSGATTTISNTVTETDMLNYTLKGNTLGTNGSIKIRMGGYILQNDGTSRAFQIKIKFGGTTIFDSTTQSMAQDAENRPFVMEFYIRNANSASSQTGTGWFACSLADVTPATGIGDINDDEVQVYSPFGMGTSSKDTASDQAVVVTMTHALASTNVQTVVQGKEITFIPGI